MISNKVITINSSSYNSYYDLVNLINLDDKEIKKRYGKNIEEWYIDVCNRIDIYFGLVNNNNKEFKRNINENYNILYYNKFNMEEYRNILKPYTDDVEDILKIEHYDIITNRLNVLVGEELLRPEIYKVVNLSEKNSKWLKDKRKELLIQLMNKMQNMEVDENGIPINEQDKKLIREQIELINSDFIAKYEEIFNKILKYIYERDNYKQLENQAIYTYLGTGCCIFKVYEMKNDVKVRLVNPCLIDFEIREEVSDISKSMCYREYRFLNFNQLIEEYGEYLDEKDIAYLTNNYEQTKTIVNNNNILKAINISNSYTFENNYRHLDSYKCIEYEFKRIVKAKLISYYDEESEENIEEIVPIDFEIEPELGINERIINITEVHECVRINNNVFIKMGKVKGTLVDIDNYNNVTSSYNGIVTKFNIIDKAKPLQALYNLIMYFLKKEMIRAKGKVFIMDIAQIPKSYGWDVEKWLYYLDVFGLVGINSLEKNDLNERATFNQFQQIDLSLGNTINSYIAQLETIKKEVIEIIGVNQQRIGLTRSTETLGGIERSVTQSIAITEPYIDYYRKGFKNVLQSTINLIKYVYPINKKIEYTNQFGAKEIILLNDPDLFLQNYGIVVTDNKIYKGIIDFMKEHSRNLLVQGGLDVHDYIRIIKSNSIEEIELILKLSEMKRQELLQQQQQIEQQKQEQIQQLEQQKLQFEQEYKMKLLEIEQQKLEIERLKAQAMIEKNIDKK